MVAGDGGEGLLADERGGTVDLLAQRGALGAVVGERRLLLHQRGVAVGQAELDELGAAGLAVAVRRQAVDGAVVDGVLVDPELDVALRRRGRWVRSWSS